MTVRQQPSFGTVDTNHTFPIPGTLCDLTLGVTRKEAEGRKMDTIPVQQPTPRQGDSKVKMKTRKKG